MFCWRSCNKTGSVLYWHKETQSLEFCFAKEQSNRLRHWRREWWWGPSHVLIRYITVSKRQQPVSILHITFCHMCALFILHTEAVKGNVNIIAILWNNNLLFGVFSHIVGIVRNVKGYFSGNIYSQLFGLDWGIESSGGFTLADQMYFCIFFN